MKLPPWPLINENFGQTIKGRSPDKNGGNYKLDRFYQILDFLNNPQKNLQNIIHIAGTNGKGSVCNYIKNILENSGYTVNLFTSPHLINFNERFYIQGRVASDDILLGVIDDIKNKIAEQFPISFFEASTLYAIQLFNLYKADFNIFEVGLGGRLDSTNIFDNPLICGITSISYDHTEILGDTLEAIASEKAGIIKNKSIVFTSKQNDVALETIKAAADKNEATLFHSPQDWKVLASQFISNNKLFYDLESINPSLLGEYQYENASLAIAIAQFLAKDFHAIKKDNILFGIENTKWNCRMQKITLNNLLDVDCIIDGAHNESGILELCKYSRQNYYSDYHSIGVFNFLENKKIDNTLKEIVETFHTLLIFCPDNFHIDNGKKLHNPTDLINIIQSIDSKKTVFVIKDFNEIHSYINKNNKNHITIFGSLYFYQYCQQ